METWVRKETGIEVEAIRLNEDNAAEVAAWCRGELIEEIDAEHPEEKQPGINVPTPTGNQRASLHMYVIKFGKHFFVSVPRVFELSYQPLLRQSPPPESIGDTRKRLGFADPFDRGRVI
jgi:hypothetical protein